MSGGKLSQFGLAALDLATHLAFRVVPVWQPSPSGCACGRSACVTTGKHPRFRGWVDAATTDSHTIRRWWTETPEASIGVATGCGSGVMVIDVDPRNGGDRSIEELEQEHSFPATLRCRTGGGGQHIYFAVGQDDDLGNGKLAPGIDLRGTGGLVVAPPSKHAAGAAYEWLSDPRETPLAKVPDWVADLTRSPADTAQGSLVGAGRRREPSQRIRLLLAHGDQDHRYDSRSEAEQAIAAGAWRAGWTFEEFSQELLDPRNVGGRKAQGLSPDDAGRYLARTWTTATQLPPPLAQPSPELSEFLSAADRWIEDHLGSGLAGSSDWAVADAVIGIVERTGKRHVGLSVRELSELAGKSEVTVRNALMRLVDIGFLEKLAPSNGRNPAVYCVMQHCHTHNTWGPVL